MRRQTECEGRSTTQKGRIAFFVDVFPVLSETFVGNQIRAVENSGWDVDVLAFRRSENAGQPDDEALAKRTIYVSDGVHDHFIPHLRGIQRAVAFAREQEALPSRSLLYHGYRLAALLRRRNVRHVHAHFAWGAAAHAIVAARLANIGVSFTGHGTDVFGKPVDLAVKARHADFVVSTCGAAADHIQSLAADANVALIPLGIDFEKFRRPTTATPPRRGLIFVARLIERKGLAETLSALARICPNRRPTLDVIGDGPERADQEANARRLGLEGVRFHGAMPSDWIANRLPEHWALVAPYFEGHDGGRDMGPVVAKEALACGVPVIASTFMGLAETVDSSCGISVPPRDVEALTAAIDASTSWTPSQQAALGQAGREKILSSFTLKIEAERLVFEIERNTPSTHQQIRRV